MAEGEELKSLASPVSNGNDKTQVTHHEMGVILSDPEKDGRPRTISRAKSINKVLQNPLAGISQDKLFQQVEDYCKENGLDDEIDNFKKGALVAQNPKDFETLPLLTEEDREALRRDRDHKWQQPRMLFWLCVLCSMCAVVQGMDETVVNGAQARYREQFGIGSDSQHDSLIFGLINAAPYLCCSIISCWLTGPLNKVLGRRGTIFLCVFVAGGASIFEAVADSWPVLFVARFLLGFGIGPVSTTTPVYAAECAPASIRGALVMMWQMWTAFGIALGFVVDLALLFVPDSSGIVGLNWRLMLGSTVIAPVFVCAQVYTCPESPRWLLGRGDHRGAFRSLAKLRNTKLEAARDLYFIHVQVEEERKMRRSSWKFIDLFTVPRNRRACAMSCLLMFMQQFCGINVIAYYSTNIFLDANFSEVAAFAASLGFGMLNFIFALPAVFTIDSFGRRKLLLTTFPLMGIFLFWAGFSFWIPGYEKGVDNGLTPADASSRARLSMIIIGIYLFTVVYSSGAGPVPVTYSAECHALSVRDVGMSLATSVLWGSNFVMAFTWPMLMRTFKPQGAFAWYAAWNFFGFVMVLLFLPETKSLTLEELDSVFNIPLRQHAAYQLRNVPSHIERFFGRDVYVEPFITFEHHKSEDDKKHMGLS